MTPLRKRQKRNNYLFSKAEFLCGSLWWVVPFVNNWHHVPTFFNNSKTHLKTLKALNCIWMALSPSRIDVNSNRAIHLQCSFQPWNLTSSSSSKTHCHQSCRRRIFQFLVWGQALTQGFGQKVFYLKRGNLTESVLWISLANLGFLPNPCFSATNSIQHDKKGGKENSSPLSQTWFQLTAPWTQSWIIAWDLPTLMLRSQGGKVYLLPLDFLPKWR